MKKLLIGLLALGSISVFAAVDEIYINDGEEVVIKVQGCRPESTPVVALLKGKVAGKCVPHITFCKAETGYLIPDGFKTSYYTYVKTPNSISKKKFLKTLRPKHLAHPAIYADLEIELRNLIKQGYCDKGIYTRGTPFTNGYTDVIVEL